MKLTSEEQTKLTQWLENEEYLPHKQTQFKCLIQLLHRSEQAAWEEVERIQQEKEVWHNGWLIFNESLLRMAYEVKRLKEENEWLKRRLLASEGYGSWETLSKQTVDDIVQNMKNADTLHEE